MYTNFPTKKNKEDNPLQMIVNKYNTTLNEIDRDVNPSTERALVDEFFDIKKQAADVYNSMRNSGGILETPGNTITYMHQPQPVYSSPIFVSDMYNGFNGPAPKKMISGVDYAVRNEIGPSPLAQQQLFQRMQSRNNPNVNAPMFAKRCINSTFTDSQQFRDNSDVIMMQADNGSYVPINNSAVYDRSGGQTCTSSYSNQSPMNGELSWQNTPVLKSVTKQEYQQNIAREIARQNQVRENQWKPVSSKYMD
jgi:hypothetical protein